MTVNRITRCTIHQPTLADDVAQSHDAMNSPESTNKVSYLPTKEAKHEGEFPEEEMHGNGKYIYKDGRVYEGEWNHGVRQGKGRLDYPNGEFQEGIFDDFLLDGVAKTTLDGGDYIYEGDVKDGARTGKGVLTSESLNMSWEGWFKEGEPHGKMLIIWSNGTATLSRLKNWAPIGWTVQLHPDGWKIEGRRDEDSQFVVRVRITNPFDKSVIWRDAREFKSRSRT